MPKGKKRLTRQRTYVGGKSVAKRIAYGRGFNKKQRVKQNAIFKETKTRSDEEVHSVFFAGSPASYYNQAPTVLHKWPNAGDKVFPLKMFSLDCQQQGVDEHMMNGRSVYAKYLKMKIQLKFPEASNVAQDQPDMFIVHGWIKTSPNLNGVNTVQGVTDPNLWTLQNDWDWMRSELEPYFDEREDKLRFIPKQNSNLAIAGYHRVKAKQREGFGRPRTVLGTITDDPATTQIRSVGTLMDYHKTINFKMMKKYHYVTGATEFAQGPSGANRTAQFWINTNQWRPFVCLYCPQLGDNVTNPPLTVDNLPEVAYNSQIWYTDS